MSHEILLRQLKLGAVEESFVVVGVVRTEGPTAVKAGNKAIIRANGAIEGWVGGHCTEKEITDNAVESLNDGTTRFLKLTTCQGGVMDIYVEPYLPKRKLVLIGHVPIVSALARIAKVLNFRVIVLDKEASKDSFPDADAVLNSIGELEKIHITKKTYFVIATMGESDQDYTRRLIITDAPYVGIVAGKKRAESILSYLRTMNLPDEVLSKMRSPAGLYLRAVTAEEIALSIMAQIVELARSQFEDLRKIGGAGAADRQRGSSLETATKRSRSQLSPSIEVDPVCGMTVETLSPHSSFLDRNRKVYFCCEACKQEFDSNPARYQMGKETRFPQSNVKS